MDYRTASHIGQNHWDYLAVANGEMARAICETRSVCTPKSARRALRMAKALLDANPTLDNEQERFGLASALGRLGAGHMYYQL